MLGEVSINKIGIEDKEEVLIFHGEHAHESSNSDQQLSVGDLNAWLQQDDGIPVAHYMVDKKILESVQNQQGDDSLEEEGENEEIHCCTHSQQGKNGCV